MRKRYAPPAEREIERAFRADEALVCPDCAVALDRRPVPPRPDVSYVRDRLWLVCPSCHASLVLDRRGPS